MQLMPFKARVPLVLSNAVGIDIKTVKLLL